jgi:glycosyltransferase involved in cell wall biosynthesis
VALTQTAPYVVLPHGCVLALALVSQGVVQTFASSASTQLLERSKHMSILQKLSERLQPSVVPQQRIEPGDLQVLLALPGWSIMRSTDREYVYERFARLNEPFRLHFAGNYGVRSLTLANLQYTLERVAPVSFHGRLPGLRVGPETQVIFSYGQFPHGLSSRVPILWEHTFAPQRSDDPERWRVQLRAEHMRAATRATRVVTATEVSAAWFRRIFPEHAHKIAAIPYYLPHLSLLPEAEVAQKAADTSRLRVVFIGKQAVRKGLDVLAAAWALLTPALRERISVTVVSALFDGAVALPGDWTHHRSVPDVTSLLRDAHVLAFPTKIEAYGLVLVEGLAAGCAILTTSAEIQRSIVGDAAGSFVDPTSPAEVAAALTQLATDAERLRRQMLAARQRFAECYEPRLVGARYAELLWATAGLHTPSFERSVKTSAPASARSAAGD